MPYRFHLPVVDEKEEDKNQRKEEEEIVHFLSAATFCICASVWRNVHDCLVQLFADMNTRLQL